MNVHGKVWFILLVAFQVVYIQHENHSQLTSISNCFWCDACTICKILGIKAYNHLKLDTHSRKKLLKTYAYFSVFDAYSLAHHPKKKKNWHTQFYVATILKKEMITDASAGKLIRFLLIE